MSKLSVDSPPVQPPLGTLLSSEDSQRAKEGLSCGRLDLLAVPAGLQSDGERTQHDGPGSPRHPLDQDPLSAALDLVVPSEDPGTLDGPAVLHTEDGDDLMVSRGHG